MHEHNLVKIEVTKDRGLKENYWKQVNLTTESKKLDSKMIELQKYAPLLTSTEDMRKKNKKRIKIITDYPEFIN